MIPFLGAAPQWDRKRELLLKSEAGSFVRTRKGANPEPRAAALEKKGKPPENRPERKKGGETGALGQGKAALKTQRIIETFHPIPKGGSCVQEKGGKMHW